MRTAGWMVVLALALAWTLGGCQKDNGGAAAGAGGGETDATKPAGDAADDGAFKPVQVQEMQKLTLDCGNGVKMQLVLIPKGKFMMGSASSEAGRLDKEGPRHEVTLTHPFYMGIYEVTQAQYEAVMGVNPSHTRGEQNPVEFVSWNQAVKFCQRLSEKTGKSVRLPTEAEWEYACRAGTTTPWFWGDNARDVGYYAWYKGNAGELNLTHPVGKKHPNPWGLYDMIGNVWELCSDGDSIGYNINDTVDPTGNKDNPGIKVPRGGSMNFGPERECRAAFRWAAGVDVTLYETGFRVVCEKE